MGKLMFKNINSTLALSYGRYITSIRSSSMGPRFFSSSRIEDAKEYTKEQTEDYLRSFGSTLEEVK